MSNKIQYVPHDAPDNGNRYLLELTERTRFNLCAALGAFKVLLAKQGIEFPPYAVQELEDMKSDILNAEAFNLNEDAEADDDFVELDDLERQILLTGLGLLVAGLQTGQVKDDLGITPRAVSTIGRKLFGIEEDA